MDEGTSWLNPGFRVVQAVREGYECLNSTMITSEGTLAFHHRILCHCFPLGRKCFG